MVNETAATRPAYYGGPGNIYEPIKVIEAWNLGFHLGNVLKYIPRAGKKDPEKELEDLKKAQWYLNRKIQQLEGTGEPDPVEQGTHYVCGFMFCFTTNEVALIEKKRPAFAAGKLNGIGGKVEPGEMPKDAMVRKFEEETGLRVEGWLHLINLNGPGWECAFYWNVCTSDEFGQIRTTTDEEVKKIDIGKIFTDLEWQTMGGLQWLIDLALYLSSNPDESISLP